MSDEAIDEMADLAAVEHVLSGRLYDVRREKDRLKRLRMESGEVERVVTDHALIRYMQRHKGIDVNAIRAELRQIANEAIPAKDREHHWHPGGVIVILGDAGQIVTVLSPEQAEKHAGRKLLNGERVPA